MSSHDECSKRIEELVKERDEYQLAWKQAEDKCNRLMTDKLTTFQQRLFDAAEAWTIAESDYTDTGRIGTQKELEADDKIRGTAKAIFLALVQRAVDKNET